MDVTLGGALIGAIATLIAAIISLPRVRSRAVLKNKQDFFYSNTDSIDYLEGHWTGQTIQDEGVTGPDMKVDLDIHLEVNQNLLVGTATVRWRENGSDELISVKMEGGFVSPRFIQFSYKYAEARLHNYGVLFLELGPESNKMKGNMVGFGHRSNAIVKGRTIIQKATN